MSSDKTFRIISKDIADKLMSIKPTYELLHFQSELDDINNAENAMSNIYGDFDFMDWLESLDEYNKNEIYKDNPVLYLVKCKDEGFISRFSQGAQLTSEAINSLNNMGTDILQTLEYEGLIEEVYPDEYDFPLDLFNTYKEMDPSNHPPSKSIKSGPHLMQRLFHHNFAYNQLSESFNQVLYSLPEDNELREKFERERDSILNFIMLVNDYDIIFRTIKNKNNG